jgi:haloalkane dehalogenase
MTDTERTGGRPAWIDDELVPFESRFVDIGGHTIHYLDEGSGPTLLLLHGNPTWSFVYRDVIRALREQFRCVAVDYPGFGLSTARPGYRHLPEEHAEVVTGFVDLLELTGVTLVAQDWGGPIGLATVEQRPTAFDAVVLANTWAWPVTGDRHVKVFSHLMGGPLGRAFIRRFNLFVNAMIPAGHRLRKPSAAEMAHYRRALSTPRRREASAVFPRRITASRSFLADVEAGLDELGSLPALIIWGDADFAFRAKERQRWEQLFPDHRTVIIERAGHFVQSDAPDQFAAAIRAWHPDLAEREPSPRPPARPRTPTVP